MRLDDFNYVLPQELIAQAPPEKRGTSRLLRLDGATGAFTDRQFGDLVQLVEPRDVLVFNDTRVINARLRGTKKSGGRVEVMVERILGLDEVLAQVGANRPPRIGSLLVLADGVRATVVGREQEFFRLRFEACADVLSLLERHGSVPLPLYIERPADAADAVRYQTVYAREPGAVAAPTAGLHFDESPLFRGGKGAAGIVASLYSGKLPARQKHKCLCYLRTEVSDTAWPPASSDFWIASRTRTTRSPKAPSDRGICPSRMQSCQS